MGYTTGSGSFSGGSGRRRYHDQHKLMREINVTPMVDVMLVLLIVFMVAAPLMTVGVPVELPKTEAAPLQGDTEPLTVTVNAEGVIFIQDTEIDISDLTDKLIAIAENGYEQRIYVRGDKTVDYGGVMEVMGKLNAAGFGNIGLVTELDDKE